LKDLEFKVTGKEEKVCQVTVDIGNLILPNISLLVVNRKDA
jgi:hypothetical protein